MLHFYPPDSVGNVKHLLCAPQGSNIFAALSQGQSDEEEKSDVEEEEEEEDKPAKKVKWCSGLK